MKDRDDPRAKAVLAPARGRVRAGRRLGRESQRISRPAERDPLAAAARRLEDLSLLHASQEVRLARLGSSIAQALKTSDFYERGLGGATAELGRVSAAAAAARERLASAEREVAALKDQLEARHRRIALLESSRVWRLRGQALRARIWAEARLGPIGRARLPAPVVARTGEAKIGGAALATIAAVPAGAATTGALEVVSPVAAAKKSVVFISHDAHPHGAQIFLLRMLRWLRENSDIPFEVILAGEGPLHSDFAEIAPVSSFQPERPSRLPDDDTLVRRLRAANVGLIYANTITNGRLLGALAALECPVITHVHELGYWIRNRVNPGDLALVRDHTTRFIAVSDAVRRALVQDAGIPHERVAVIHGFVPTRAEEYVHRREPHQIRRELGIPEEARIVCACGTMDWRKAPDLFIQLSQHVHRRVSRPRVHFLWVGGSDAGNDRSLLWHDVVQSGLADTMHFIGHCDNAQDYFAACDVFALTSREDPFPLVVMEAATAGVPTVCFDASGGAKEFVEDDCGFVVPYLDTAAMADRIVEILSNPPLRARLGRRAAEKVAQRHGIDIVGPLLLKEIHTALRNGGRIGSTEVRCG